MPEKKYELTWRWDKSYAVIEGTPSGWEVRAVPFFKGDELFIHLAAYFDNCKYGSHDLASVNDVDEHEKVLNAHPEAVDAAIDAGIQRLQQHINTAAQMLGMTARQ